MAVTRVVSMDDAEALTSELSANREFLAPWSPIRPDEYFTVEVQRAVVAKELDAYAREAMLPLVILDGGGRLAGRIHLNEITRGAFQSASVGYWVSQAHNGRGLASAAVAEVIEIAFKNLGLHRLQAETLLYNVRSQRVLTRNGFKPFAVAPSYIQIAGEWQDHIMFQLLNEKSARTAAA
jgi:[ribosomal protein S5]-alanine N-acetyltransferase